MSNLILSGNDPGILPLVGPQGQQEIPHSALGLYPAGKCPECGRFIYHHAAIGQPDRIYSLCPPGCNAKTTLKVPAQYNGRLERRGIDYLFTLIQGLHDGSIERDCDQTNEVEESAVESDVS